MTENARTIVVPLDGSTVSEAAVPVAAWLAKATGAAVRFVHVIDDDRLADTPQEITLAKDRFATYSRGLAERAGVAESTTDVLSGDAAAQLLRAAEGAAFVVIASHGRGGFRASLVGSVADKVVRGTPVPVFLVPGAPASGAPARGKPFVVGLDGSPEAERSLALARELAAATGAKLALVRAFSIPPPVGIEFSYYPPDVITSLQDSATEYMRAMVQPGESERVVQGDAATAIQDAAKELDAGLVVLTSGGKGLAKRLAFGSVTDRVMHAIERTLLIVPPKRD
ncbi:MAG: universal stress protein [Anaerolineaceae bacterium]